MVIVEGMPVQGNKGVNVALVQTRTRVTKFIVLGEHVGLEQEFDKAVGQNVALATLAHSHPQEAVAVNPGTLGASAVAASCIPVVSVLFCVP
jgi:hypothetical protein